MQRLFIGALTIVAVCMSAAACGNVIGIDDNAKLDTDAGATPLNQSEPAFAEDDDSMCDPSTCPGTCHKWGCDFDCSNSSCQGKAFACPPGNDCNILCSGTNCNGATCSGSRACRFDCTSAECNSTTCTAASCELYCNGDQSCKGSAGCPSSDTATCSVECGKPTDNDACHVGILCCGKSCPPVATCPPSNPTTSTRGNSSGSGNSGPGSGGGSGDGSGGKGKGH